MKRHFVLTLALLLAVAALALAQATVHTVKLTGDQEATPVGTKAHGQFILKIQDGEWTYRLVVNNIDNTTAAHLHLAPVGDAGPVVVDLFLGPTKEGQFSGVLAEGTITDADLKGPLAGQTLEALHDAIAAGDIYVNVHTTQNGPGEIRAQLP